MEEPIKVYMNITDENDCVLLFPSGDFRPLEPERFKGKSRRNKMLMLNDIRIRINERARQEMQLLNEKIN